MLKGRDAYWSLVHAERRALVDDLRGLTPTRWETPSLCEDWSVHDVLAHLVDVAQTTRLGFVRRLVAARFDFDRDNQRGIERERRDDPTQTLAAFEAVADLTATPPAPLATRLVEEIVHGEDIRRPLGIHRTYPTDGVVAALQYQLKTSIKLGGGKERTDGLHLVATDADLIAGTGDEVHGTALALLCAVSGRPVDPSELTGPGAERLRPA